MFRYRLHLADGTNAGEATGGAVEDARPVLQVQAGGITPSGEILL